MIRSFATSQDEILSGIMDLRGIERFDADLTYGRGAFYRGSVPEPRMKFDLRPRHPDVIEADSRALPLPSNCVTAVIFDPPFLTYIRTGEDSTTGIMGRHYSGYWTWNDLEAHYRGTLAEAARVLRRGGTLVFKVQDLVHHHQLQPTHALVMGWASGAGLALQDLFVLGASHRMPGPNRAGRQRHARVSHCYFLVFERRLQCQRCGHPLERKARSDARWCSSACRQSAYRGRLIPKTTTDIEERST